MYIQISGGGGESRYEDNLVLCGESEDDLRTKVGCFVEVCRRSLKVNADKSKVTVLNGEEGLE